MKETTLDKHPAAYLSQSLTHSNISVSFFRRAQNLSALWGPSKFAFHELTFPAISKAVKMPRTPCPTSALALTKVTVRQRNAANLFLSKKFVVLIRGK